MSSRPEGKPPKSAEAIRASLSSIHETADVENRIGPDADGLDSDDQIVVATFHDRSVARSFQRELNRAGIYSTIARHKQGARVTVDYEDRVAAADLHEKHRQSCPDQRPRGQSKRYDFLIFGVTIGLTCGAALFAESWSHRLAIVVPVTYAVIGALSGHLVDCLRMNYYRTRRIRIGSWEFLVMSNLCAVFIFAWRILPQMLID